MALSEFMPYGAPELLEGARTRMARSTLVASLAVASLVACAGLFASRGVTVIGPGDVSRVFDPLPPVLEPPVIYETPKAEPAIPRSDPSALPVPVPDRVAPPDVAPEVLPVPAGPVGEAGSGPPRLQGHGSDVAPPAVDPPPGVYVYYDEPPVLVRSVEAHYPELPREAGVEGLVRVLMLVELDGRVKRAIIAPGGSVPMLDDAALEAARQCVFTPALSNNHPVKVWVSRNYRFTLH